jgi:hypothetical protein
MLSAPWAWVLAVLVGRGPFLLSWREDDKGHRQTSRWFADAARAASRALAQSRVEAMALTDRAGRRLLS